MTNIIYGTNDSEILAGVAGDTNLIKGFSGDDTITGSSFDDTIFGGDGNDILGELYPPGFYDYGDDIMNGGAGRDTIIDYRGANILIGGEGGDAIFTNSESRVYGNEGDDLLYGGNYAKGGDGSDFLASGVHESDLFGEAGTDYFAFTFKAGVHAKIHDFDAAAGESITINSSSSNSPVITENSAGDAVIRTEVLGEGKHYITLKGVDAADLEIHQLGSNSFQIDSATGDETGNAGNNIVNGTSGDNTLYGFKGNDTLLGGDGNDELIGGRGYDRLEGASGSDTLVGGTEQDYLIGGAGADVFAFAEGDSYRGNGTRDAIKDFEFGIDLLQYEGGGAPAGALEISMVGLYTSLHFTDADFEIQMFGDFTTQATADIDSFFV